MSDQEPKTLFTARRMKPASSDDGEVIRFEFSDGVVLTAFDPGTCRGAAVLVPSAVLPENWMEGTIREIGRHVDLRSGTAQIKLLGTAAPMNSLAAVLARHQVAVTTSRQLEPGKHEIFFYVTTGRARLSRIAAEAPRKVKVLIVDDSRTIRDLMSKILSSDPMIDVVATADGPEPVEGLIARHKPDVITLDIHMPGMDGVTLLKKYLPRHPIPTVMISSISMEEGPLVLSALENGAVEYIQKPSFDQLKTVAPVIIEKIKAASMAKVTVTASTSRPTKSSRVASHSGEDLTSVVAIGSSTGGTEALRKLMAGLPDRIPPIVIVQHIPPVFSKAFALRMNEMFAFDVREAEDGDRVLPNQVLIAPGGKQMSLKRLSSGEIRVVVDDRPPVNRHKPSVDVLFDSVAKELGDSAIGVILTGMGADGARGMLKMRQAGCPTIAQDEASCVVFGMPREAIALGGAQTVLPLDQIASKVISLAQQRARNLAKKAV